MVINRYGKKTLRVVLTDDILIEKILYFYRFGQFFQTQLRSSCFTCRSPHSFLSNLVSLYGATVADITVYPCNEKTHFMLRSSAETEIGRASCRERCRSRWSPYH